jgi:CubicO group peptidase (beta-lactamase class C family)
VATDLKQDQLGNLARQLLSTVLDSAESKSHPQILRARIVLSHFRMLSVLGLTCVSTSLALACDLPENRPHREAHRLDNHVDTETFIDHVRETIDDGVMGYAVILRSPTGRKIAEVSHGWAQSPCEDSGARAYGINTVTPWASVTKMVTTAAVLNKIRRFSTRRLDERMIDHLPKRWTVTNCDGTSTCWSDVEIRHLLSYQAGFGGGDGLGWEDTLALPATPRPVGVRKYSNAPFSVWHYMGSFFAGGKMEAAEAAFQGGHDDYEDYIFAAVREIWTDVLNKQIFAPLDIRATCGDVAFAGDNLALLYNYKTPASDGQPGYHPGSGDGTNCTSGGIVMSVNDMSKFVHALANTDKIISRKQYENHLAIIGNDVFGWNGSNPTTDGRVWYKHGGSTGGNGHVGTDILAFSSGYTATIAVNSFQRRHQPSNWSRLGVLTDAYEAAIAESTGVLTIRR